MINYIEEVIYHDDDVSSSQIILQIQRKQKKIFSHCFQKIDKTPSNVNI